MGLDCYKEVEGHMAETRKIKSEGEQGSGQGINMDAKGT